jgi:hypothetical protein
LPGFINGQLPRPRGVRKVLFYWFDESGEVMCQMVPIAKIELRERQLTLV